MSKDVGKIMKSLGKCPICNSDNWWLNDVPLKGFCWGTKDNPHNEVKRLVPRSINPYLIHNK